MHLERHGGKIFQDIADPWKDTDFTLRGRGKPIEGFELRNKGIWLTHSGY